MTILKLCMIALLILTSTTVIRTWRSDFLPLVRIGAVVLFGTLFIASVGPLLSLVKSLGGGAGASQYHPQGLGNRCFGTDHIGHLP